MWLNARYGFTVDRFAAPFKQAARDWFSLTDDQIDGDRKELIDPRWDKTPREIMQLLGTEVGRLVHPDVWALAAMTRHHRRSPAMTVIADLRYPNEARILRAHGGKLLYVFRPDFQDNEFSGHASEQFIEEIGATAEFQVLNHGSVEDLQDNLACLDFGER